MKCKVELKVLDMDGNLQIIYLDGVLKSENSLHTEGGKIYLTGIQGMTIDCMPDIRKEN